MTISVFLLASEALGCKPLPFGMQPQMAGRAELMDFAPATVKGIPEEISPALTKNGTFRVRVIEWVKGSGPGELVVQGLTSTPPANTGECGLDRNLVRLGKRYWLIFNELPVGKNAEMFKATQIPAGQVVRVAYPAETFY